MSSTICALATPPGAGGIAVVRVSGPEAYAVVEEIFTPRNPAPPCWGITICGARR